MEKKLKFKKSYINPQAGYWEDKETAEKRKWEEWVNQPTTFAQASIDLSKGFNETIYYFLEGVKLTRDTTDHLCIGKRCLICEARNLPVLL